jgi:hypothetical protein
MQGMAAGKVVAAATVVVVVGSVVVVVVAVVALAGVVVALVVGPVAADIRHRAVVTDRMMLLPSIPWGLIYYEAHANFASASVRREHGRPLTRPRS